MPLRARWNQWMVSVGCDEATSTYVLLPRKPTHRLHRAGRLAAGTFTTIMVKPERGAQRSPWIPGTLMQTKFVAATFSTPC